MDIICLERKCKRLQSTYISGNGECMNIYDVSEKAGVSIATVSRVLNGNANVSEKTRQKVLDVMEKCGYTPNAFARGLGLNTMKTIGLLCTDSSNVFQAKAISYIEQQLQEAGYDSILCCSGYELESKKKCMNLLLNKKVDAIILISSHFVYATKEENQYIADAGAQVPVMILNGEVDAPNVYGVLTDDMACVYKAVTKLYEDGLRRILYFYHSNSYSGKKKLEGYEKGIEDFKLEKDENLRQFYEASLQEIPKMAEYLLELWESGVRFEGIMTSDDELALGALKFAKLAGLKVPEQLSVIGYSNSMLATSGVLELTSVDIRLEKVCQHLISNLLRLFDGEEIPQQAYFSGELIERETTL